MSFFQLVTLDDKTIEGNNTILECLSIFYQYCNNLKSITLKSSVKN